MEFGWINGFGAVIVVLMLIPNVVYAVKYKGEKNRCTNGVMNAIEQIGRYGSMILMWLPLFVWKFGFASEIAMLLYFAANGILLAAYWIVYAMYFKKRNAKRAIILAILPSCIFLLSGILLRHWTLVAFALLFAIGHLYVTYENARSD